MSPDNASPSTTHGWRTRFKMSETGQQAAQWMDMARALGRELRLHDPLVYTATLGTMPAGAGPLSLHYLGRKRFANDFLAFYDVPCPVSGVSQQVCPQGNPLRFALERRRIETTPAVADLLVVDRFLDLAPNPSGVQVATHLTAVLPLEKSIELQMQQVRSKGHRRRLQAALKRGFTWRKSHKEADFHLFYDQMYAPLVHDRFAFGASLAPRDQMLREFKRCGTLLFVEQDGVPVSGAFLYTTRREPGSLKYWKYGVAGSASLSPNAFGERNAMTEAMVLQYAIDERFSELDFGLTRAMPRDGVFIHKKRLGCNFRLPRDAAQFSLHISPAAKARVLSQFPMVVVVRGAVEVWLAHRGPFTAAHVGALQDTLSACAFDPVSSIRLFTEDTGSSHASLAAAVVAMKSQIECSIEIEPLS